jgi:cyclopropane-fatty-acyl-phospholipid synthase
MSLAISLAERGLVPDTAVRVGIRRILRRVLRAQEASTRDFVAEMAAAPIAIGPGEANAQHYEVPAAFFERVLGPNMKYSACYFSRGVTRLADAEEAMLALTAARARLSDGQRVLDLGCGWGSLTLWAARRFPGSRFVAVSNSTAQREFIAARAPENVEVITADMNDFEAPGRFDRVVSIEMFEHVRNWAALLARVHGWLAPEGRLFVHVFAHRQFAYPYEDVDGDDWMARTFFSGGMMPSVDLIERVGAPFRVVERNTIDGTHYARTAEAWLDNLDRHRVECTRILGDRRAVSRWRMFFLACAELFGYAHGREWMVAHHLLAPT